MDGSHPEKKRKRFSLLDRETIPDKTIPNANVNVSEILIIILSRKYL
jgi:hypothetical protein